MKEQLIGQATQEQIDAWKKANPLGIYALISGGHIGYFKNPSRQELNCAMSKADTSAPLDMYEELATLTFIDGSRELLDNDNKFIGIATQMKQKFEGEKAELVNL